MTAADGVESVASGGRHEAWGKKIAIPSGCIAMTNQDAIDNYDRVSVGALFGVLGPTGNATR